MEPSIVRIRHERDAALAEVARLRAALARIAGLDHADECRGGHDPAQDPPCCGVTIAWRALAEGGT